MKLRQKIILIILSAALGPAAPAYGGGVFDWMNINITALGSFLPKCIEAPSLTNINQSSTGLNVENNNLWVPTGVFVQEGKMLALAWDTSGITPQPEKYRLLYRVDPRFGRAQVFIQKYDYSQQKYLSDFNSYKNGVLPFYQQRMDIFSAQRMEDFNNYFNFSGRQNIKLQKDDVVNVVLDTTGGFFGSGGDMQSGLGSLMNPLTIFTDSSGINNKIIYASARRWCEDIITRSNSASYLAKCSSYPGRYLNPADQIPQLVGKPSDADFTSKLLSIPSCPDNANGPDNVPLCFYDKGRGFKVTVGGRTIKDTAQQFVYSPYTGKYFLYHYSDAEGDLNFINQWPIAGMYTGLMSTMEEWKIFTGSDDAAGYTTFTNYLGSVAAAATTDFFHLGSYALEIEIGRANPDPAVTGASAIQVDYFISDSASPDDSSVSYSASQDFKGDAYASGYLWLKVVGGAGNSGVINVKTANYTGSTWFSSVIYGSLVQPLREKYNELSEIIYRELVSNPTLQNIARSALTLYVIIYGLLFLAGAVQITATDIIMRVAKISLIIALFSPTSWGFFNDNLFKLFVEGSDYLFSSVTGVTSSVGNVFGFIDPILDRYNNGNLWALLFIQLFQLDNGLAVFAILTIYSLLIYFRAVLEVVITYCLAFLGLAVMISLAPFFIILMLFEQTKSMFDNWLSTLFSYMIQPTLLLIFFLMLDQIMSTYIKEIVTRACWGILIPLTISIDLSSLHIPISFSFALPFLPGIPFYIPVVENIGSIEDLFASNGTFVRLTSSCFIFFIYCKLSAGLVEYVTLVVQHLTNVLAARQYGKLQGSQNLVKDIVYNMKKLTSPSAAAAGGAAGFVKEKLIDQKITHRTKSIAEEPDYSRVDGGGREAADLAGKIAGAAGSSVQKALQSDKPAANKAAGQEAAPGVPALPKEEAGHKAISPAVGAGRSDPGLQPPPAGISDGPPAAGVGARGDDAKSRGDAAAGQNDQGKKDAGKQPEREAFPEKEEEKRLAAQEQVRGLSRAKGEGAAVPPQDPAAGAGDRPKDQEAGSGAAGKGKSGAGEPGVRKASPERVQNREGLPKLPSGPRPARKVKRIERDLLKENNGNVGKKDAAGVQLGQGPASGPEPGGKPQDQEAGSRPINKKAEGSENAQNRQGMPKLPTGKRPVKKVQRTGSKALKGNDESADRKDK